MNIVQFILTTTLGVSVYSSYWLRLRSISFLFILTTTIRSFSSLFISKKSRHHFASISARRHHFCVDIRKIQSCLAPLSRRDPQDMAPLLRRDPQDICLSAIARHHFYVEIRKNSVRLHLSAGRIIRTIWPTYSEWGSRFHSKWVSRSVSAELFKVRQQGFVCSSE